MGIVLNIFNYGGFVSNSSCAACSHTRYVSKKASSSNVPFTKANDITKSTIKHGVPSSEVASDSHSTSQVPFTKLKRISPLAVNVPFTKLKRISPLAVNDCVNTFDFTKFDQLYKVFRKGKVPSYEAKCRAVGLFESCTYLDVNEDKKSCIITFKNLQALHDFKKSIKFGISHKLDPSISISSSRNVDLLFSLLNGNLTKKKSLDQLNILTFLHFLRVVAPFTRTLISKAYKINYEGGVTITFKFDEIIRNLRKPNNYWLEGFKLG